MVSAMLKARPEITALFSAGYEMTPACLKAARDMGLRVPADLSIISYVDSDIMPLLDPPVSALRMPFYEMGRRAADVVVQNAPQKAKILLDCELMLRESTGAPAAR